MSIIPWEYNLVEHPFCEQLKAIDWQWIEGKKYFLTVRIREAAGT